MASTATYLNFAGNTEEAFAHYKRVFQTEYQGPVVRFGDMPPMEGQPEPSEANKEMILNIALPITGGHIIYATDAPKEMGFDLNPGNHMHIMVMPDSRAEADRLFAGLSEGGEVHMPMAQQFWGDYYGSFVDQFGINWMINSGTNP